MKQLIVENLALSYYGSIADNIEKYKSRKNVNTTSADLPLFVDQIARLREIFQKAIASIEDSEINSSGKLGTKLREIMTIYRPAKNINDYVLNAWQKVNEARHYWELYSKGTKLEFEEKHYKQTLRSICSFINEYSGVLVPEKVFKFYTESYPLDNTAVKHSRKRIPLNNTNNTVVKTQKNVPLTSRQMELIKIPDTRLPILFVLDTSLSMNENNRIDDLNKGVEYFYKSIATDEITSDSIEFSIITFGHEVEHFLEFSNIERANEVMRKQKFEATGVHTCIGEAMLKALDVVNAVKIEYSDNGISYHQPWIVLITDCDGEGIDDYQNAAEKVSERILDEKLVLFPIAVGLGNLEILGAFSPTRDPLLMRNKNFSQFFAWLVENAKFISQSRPDEKKPLSPPHGWASL